MVDKQVTSHPEQDELKIRAKAKLERELGPVILEALYDPVTVEILLNADGLIWQEKLGHPMSCIGSLTPAKARAVINTVWGSTPEPQKFPSLENF